jgi:uncharacterized membrane protein YphA (DoxX/SURF4 family)
MLTVLAVSLRHDREQTQVQPRFMRGRTFFKGRPFMSTRLTTLCRVLLGLILVTFGSDYFLHFMPEQPISKEGLAFLEALLATGYLFGLIKGIEIAAGILLLAGRLVPLALVMLAPVVVNIVLYHVYLDPNGIGIGLATGILLCILLIAYRKSFEGMWAAPQLSPSRPLSGGPQMVKPSFGD